MYRPRRKIENSPVQSTGATFLGITDPFLTRPGQHSNVAFTHSGLQSVNSPAAKSQLLRLLLLPPKSQNPPLSNSLMGQVIATIQGKFQGKQWRQKQLRKITDKVFDHFKDDYGKDHLAFEDLYIAVLFVYNDINKHLPGPHIDPPPKGSVKAMMETYDTNLDGQLDREEFADFIQKLAGDTLCVVSRNLIIALIVAPMVALMTKRATEGVPGVGKVVRRLPNSVYATIVALGVMLIQKSGEECD